MAIPQYVVGEIIGLSFAARFDNPITAVIGAQIMGSLVGIAMGWMYFSIMESSPWQATLGKKALGIIVVDLNGDRLTWGRATGRFFGRIVSSILMGIGFLMAAFTPKKQALHDMMAGTLVVNKPDAIAEGFTEVQQKGGGSAVLKHLRWVIPLLVVLILLLVVQLVAVYVSARQNQSREESEKLALEQKQALAKAATEQKQAFAKVVTVKSEVELKWPRISAMNLDRKQGVGAVLDEIEVMLVAANALYDKEQYAEALTRYEKAAEGCGRVMVMEASRRKTKAEGDAATAFLNSKTAMETAKDAGEQWGKVMGLAQSANAAFEGGRFEEADRLWLATREEYEKTEAFVQKGRKAKDVALGLGKPRIVDLGDGVVMEFVWIPALNLWVGKYEVTNGEYRKFKPDHNSGAFQRHSLNGDRQPVVQVNFVDAKAFAEWLTERERQAARLPAGYRFRLPAKDEWLIFAQCGDGREYPWGNNWPPPNDWNYHGQEGAGSCLVEKSGKNDWGLYGVGGNVWEVTASGPSGASFGAWRGASWFDDYQDYLRCSYRHVGEVSARGDRSGFRLVLSL